MKYIKMCLINLQNRYYFVSSYKCIRIHCKRILETHWEKFIPGNCRKFASVQHNTFSELNKSFGGLHKPSCIFNGHGGYITHTMDNATINSFFRSIKTRSISSLTNASESEEQKTKICSNAKRTYKVEYENSFKSFRTKSKFMLFPSSQTIRFLKANLCHLPQGQQMASKISGRGMKSQSLPGNMNPLLEIQEFVSTPILLPQEAVFSPTENEVLKAVAIFSGEADGHRSLLEHRGSYADGKTLPENNLPEIAFLGRSNVGKSSLIRSMLNRHQHVKIGVSKQPGHTRKLNLYSLGRHFTFVDMPGYGYNMPDHFQQSVEAYLRSRRRLCRTFLLIDAEVGLISTDEIALEMLQEVGVSYVIVLTKIDKVGRHKLLENLFAVLEACRKTAGHTCFSQPFLVSSRTGDGIALLETFIAYVTGCVEIKGL